MGLSGSESPSESGEPALESTEENTSGPNDIESDESSDEPVGDMSSASTESDDSVKDKTFDVAKLYAHVKRKLNLSSSEEEAIAEFERKKRRKKVPKAEPDGQVPGPSTRRDERSPQPGPSSRRDESPPQPGPAGSQRVPSSSSEVEEEESVLVTEAEVERMASVSSRVYTNALLRRSDLTPDQVAEFNEAFKGFRKAPTLLEIRTYYDQRIRERENEISDLKRKKSVCLKAARQFWISVKRAQARRLQQHIGSRIPTRSKKKSATNKKSHPCPIPNCPGRCYNIKRHLAQCHKYLTRAEQEKLLKLHQEMIALKKTYSPKKSPRKASPRKSPKQVKVRYPPRLCAICDKKVRRLDVHAVKVHEVKRGSDVYNQILRDSPLQEKVEPAQGQTVEIRAGHVTVTTTDKIKEFLEEYEKYLRNRTPLGDQIIKQAVRCVGEVLRSESGEDPCTTLSGAMVCKTLDKLAQVTPPGFLESRKEMYSPNYIRRIVLSCRRAVDFMGESKTQFSIDRMLKLDTTARLDQISMSYVKAERKQKVESRVKKERSNVPLEVCEKLLTSEHMKNVTEAAKGCLENEDILPTTLSDFTNLRDLIILKLMVTSLRRVMEFSEFRLSEYDEIEARGESSVIKIARHKTAEQGPSLVVLDKGDTQLLEAYIRFYRPIAAPCAEPNCYVFPNRLNLTGASCCSKMSFSTMCRSVKRTTKRCGVDVRLTSRILRRSQITALWEESSDPSWRQQVATQCGHSLETASRYYEYSSKVAPGIKVVKKLQELREKSKAKGRAAAEHEESSVSSEDADETPAPDVLADLTAPESEAQRQGEQAAEVPTEEAGNKAAGATVREDPGKSASVPDVSELGFDSADEGTTVTVEPDIQALLSTLDSETNCDFLPPAPPQGCRIAERNAEAMSLQSEGTDTTFPQNVSVVSSGMSSSFPQSVSVVSAGASSNLPHSVSVVSAAETSSLPAHVSVMSSSGALSPTATPDLSPVKRTDTFTFYRDCKRAIDKCAAMKRAGFKLINWNRVKEMMDLENPEYKGMTLQQVRDRFKYVKGIKKKAGLV